MKKEHIVRLKFHFCHFCTVGLGEVMPAILELVFQNCNFLGLIQKLKKKKLKKLVGFKNWNKLLLRTRTHKVSHQNVILEKDQSMENFEV